MFRNGYKKDSPWFIVELKKIEIGLGIIGLGAPEKEQVYILKLGKLIEGSINLDNTNGNYFSKELIL